MRTGQSSRGGGGRAGGSAGSGGGGSFGGGSTGGAMDPQVMRAFRESTQQPRTLRIQQTDTSVTIAGQGRPLTVLTNGALVADSTLEGQITYSVKSSWKKDQLVIERQMSGGTVIRSTYYLDKKDAKTLIVDVRFESKQMTRTVDNRRVYSAAAGS